MPTPPVDRLHQRYYQTRSVNRALGAPPGWPSYPAFAAWARANGYAPGRRLHRARKGQPYGPNNAAWVDPADAALGRRVAGFGAERTVRQWARSRACQVGEKTLAARLAAGEPLETAVARRGGRPKPAGADPRLYRAWRSVRSRAKALGVPVDPAWADYAGFRDWARANGYAPTRRQYLARTDPARGFTRANCEWRAVRK